MSPPPVLVGSVKRPWSPAIDWHMVAEHLSEATFLWKLWERSLDAADHTLEEVAEGDERRLQANLEGLVIGGRRVAERLLLPCLAQEEEVPAMCVAATCLLAATDTDWLGPLLERLDSGGEPLRQGVLRALALSGREDISGALRRRVPRAEPALQVLLLDALRARCADPGEALEHLDLGAPELLAAAIRAARFAPRGPALTLVQRGLASSEALVAEAALETGLILGLRAAWARCRRQLESPDPASRLALLALATGGTARDLEALAARAAVPRTRTEALWALGFSGRLSAAESVLQALHDPGAARFAVESFALITGLPLRPPFVEEDEARDEEPAPTQQEAPEAGLLPAPEVPAWRVHAEQVARWWAQSRGRFTREGRWIRGRPFDAEALLLALEEVSMRRRQGLLLELAIRGGGSCAVEPRGWASQQRQQARSVRGLRPTALVRSYDEMLTA